MAEQRDKTIEERLAEVEEVLRRLDQIYRLSAGRMGYVNPDFRKRGEPRTPVRGWYRGG